MAAQRIRAAASIGLLSAVCGWAQFSPGRLSSAHQSLEGPTKCVACHSVNLLKRSFKCLNCHAEIRERLSAGQGLHPALVQQGGERRDCSHCHAEHQGEKFVPIRWDVDLSEFDHGRTGYPLEGSHRGLECRKCHQAKNVPAAARRRILVKDLTRTYLGLSRACSSCHLDAHRGQLALDCLRCHTYSKWKPAAKFDHARAKYPLDGALQKLACQKCHPPTGEKSYLQFAGLRFTGCDSCHKDPHRAAFANPCVSCHSLAGWKPARLATQFDHSRTQYALAGKHATLACDKCHATVNFKQPVAHANCTDCHRKEPHGGQFAGRVDRGACSACHTPNGWKPSTFTLAAHRETRYPLEGRHAAVPCAKCHVPAGQNTVYRVHGQRCADCHQDPHKARLAGRYADRCEECHTVNRFRPSTYSAAKHAASRFALAGAHLAVTCADCHHRAQGGQAPVWQFQFARISCRECHEDPHRDQFQHRLAAARAVDPAGCDACHSFRTWRDTSRFDHAATSFPLKGAHRSTLCVKCHRPADPGSPVKNVVFASAPKQCSGCHQDAHEGQFLASPGGAECGRCHEPLQWKPALFNHEDASAFALTGAHRGVECRLCHTAQKEVNGRRVMLFKPTPRECKGCHLTQITGLAPN